jgi:hypothetical protein
MLARRSGGVPLFVRAIILRLIETGALFRSSGGWVLGAGAAAEVPALVGTLLRGKIDGYVLRSRGLKAGRRPRDPNPAVAGCIPRRRTSLATSLRCLSLNGVVSTPTASTEDSRWRRRGVS